MVLLLGCSKTTNVVGTWIASDKNYTFYDDGSCMKTVVGSTFACTYEVEKGVINIYLNSDPEEIYESGQVNKDIIIIGSDLYSKGE